MGGRDGEKRERPIKEPKIKLPEEEEPETPEEEPVTPVQERPPWELVGFELRERILKEKKSEEREALEQEQERLSKEIMEVNFEVDTSGTTEIYDEEENYIGRYKDLLKSEYQERHGITITPYIRERLEEIAAHRKTLFNRAHVLAEQLESSNYRLQEIKDRESEQLREQFFVKRGQEIVIDLTLNPKSNLFKEHSRKITKQKEFLERFVSVNTASPAASTPTVKIKAVGEKGSGGISLTGENVVRIGTEYVGTTPLHEFTHQVEDQLGLRSRRGNAFKTVLEKMTGKKVGDIELVEWTSYVDSKGKKHHATVRGEKVYIPKGIFSTQEEESKYGYMFRIYRQQLQERYEEGKTKRYIHPLEERHAEIGTEAMPKALEYIWKEPKEFAKKYPDIFDITVDIMRGWK